MSPAGVMHAYAIDSDERVTIIATLAALSLAVTNFVSWLILETDIIAPLESSAISSISTMSIFGGLFLLFDRYLWRARVLRTIGMVKTPDLNGMWNGVTRSSIENYEESIESSLRITQTWTRIQLQFQGQHANSSSCMCHMTVSVAPKCMVAWEYLVRPKPSAPGHLVMHYGTVKLEGFFDTKKTINYLEGEYYTERDRSSYGEQKFYRT